MKRKTDFKQMYLVDNILYNKISDVTPQLPTSMVVGKFPTNQSPQASNFQPISIIKREVLEEGRPNQSKMMRSTETMTDEPPTNTSTQPRMMKSSGMMTENMQPTTVEVPSQQHQINALQEQLHNSQLQVRSLEASLRTPQVVDHSQLHHALVSDYTPRSKNRSLRRVNHSSRLEHRAAQPDHQTQQMEDRTMQLDFRTPQLDYRTPQLEYRTPRKDDRTMQLNYRTPQPEFQPLYLKYHIPQPPALDMEHSNMIQNIPLSHQVNEQQLAISSEPRYSRPMDTSPAPEQLELMDFNTNKTLEYQSSPQPMDSSETALALPPPVVTATRALPPPVEDECKECSDDSTITKYVKYNEPGIVALPSVQGLPDNILFTCTLCNTDFNTQRALQRHMKNQHDAFDQKEKGAKRKLAIPSTNSVVTNTMKKSKTDKNLRNKAVVSYTKYL